MILTADGLILTNNHVIDGATTLEVQFNDGSTATATVVGADATDDLAVIKAQGVSGLTPATIGTSANVQVGQDVVAVGSPLGLSATVTSGIVSALNRPVATSNAQQQDPQQQQFPGRGPEPDPDPGRNAGDRDQRHPDRRGDQPRQLRWPARRHERQGHRHQLGDRLAVLRRQR